MVLLSFIKSFKKKKISNQISRLQTDVSRLSKKLSTLNNQMNNLSSTSDMYISKLNKLDTHQKEMIIQLDSLGETIDDQSGTQLFIDTLLTLSTQIEHFYFFSQEEPHSPLHTQASMMWTSAKRCLTDVGINVIDECSVPINTSIHTVEDSGFNSQLPNGYVLKVLSCGYTYNGNTIRRASVIVNKNDNMIIGKGVNPV